MKALTQLTFSTLPLTLSHTLSCPSINHLPEALHWSPLDYTFPGTHNSNSYHLKNCSMLLYTSNEACEAYYMNQTHTLLQQLDNGVRALDLDYCTTENDEILSCHDKHMNQESLSFQLDSVLGWLRENPCSFLMIRFSNISPSASAEKVLGILRRHEIFSALLPWRERNGEMGELVERGRHILPIFSSDESYYSYASRDPFWKDYVFNEKWTYGEDISIASSFDMLDSLRSVLLEYRAGWERRGEERRGERERERERVDLLNIALFIPLSFPLSLEAVSRYVNHQYAVYTAISMVGEILGDIRINGIFFDRYHSTVSTSEQSLGYYREMGEGGGEMFYSPYRVIQTVYLYNVVKDRNPSTREISPAVSPRRLQEGPFQLLSSPVQKERDADNGETVENQANDRANTANETPGSATNAIETASNSGDAKEMPKSAIDANETPSNLVDANEMPDSATNANETPSNSMDANQMPGSATDANETPSNSMDANQMPGSATNANELSLSERDVNETPIGINDANETSLNARDANDTATIANETSSNERDANETLGRATDANETSFKARDANETPIGMPNANETSLNARDANETPEVEMAPQETSLGESVASKNVVDKTLANETLANEKFANETDANETEANKEGEKVKEGGDEEAVSIITEVSVSGEMKQVNESISPTPTVARNESKETENRRGEERGEERKEEKRVREERGGEEKGGEERGGEKRVGEDKVVVKKAGEKQRRETNVRDKGKREVKGREVKRGERATGNKREEEKKKLQGPNGVSIHYPFGKCASLQYREDANSLFDIICPFNENEGKRKYFKLNLDDEDALRYHQYYRRSMATSMATNVFQQVLTSWKPLQAHAEVVDKVVQSFMSTTLSTQADNPTPTKLDPAPFSWKEILAEYWFSKNFHSIMIPQGTKIHFYKKREPSVERDLIKVHASFRCLDSSRSPVRIVENINLHEFDYMEASLGYCLDG